MISTSSSPKQRIRKREESDRHCQRDKTVVVDSDDLTKIPIQNRIRRTRSELQFQEDTKAAEWRDLCMFSRLVGGMRERQNAQASHFRTAQQEQQQGRSGRGSGRSAAASNASGPETIRAYNRHALQTERCVENIVWTRRQEIRRCAISIDDADLAFESVEITGRRFSRGTGRPVTHSEAYDHYGAEDRSRSAPPPLFPDLRAVSSATQEAPPQQGRPSVDPDEDSGEACVFNLDL